MHRHIYRNCLLIAVLAEALILIVIIITWVMMIKGLVTFGDPLTNAVVAGVFALVGAQIALAGDFAPRSDQEGNNGHDWYPNVVIHVGMSALNALLVLAMGTHAVVANLIAPEYVIVAVVVALVFGVIGQLLGLATRFAPKG